MIPRATLGGTRKSYNVRSINEFKKNDKFMLHGIAITEQWSFFLTVRTDLEWYRVRGDKSPLNQDEPQPAEHVRERIGLDDSICCGI
jgi:hypothetical protein